MYVKVPKDINEYEHKVFKGLTARNIKWGIVSFAIALSLFFLLKPFMSNMLLSWLCMLSAVPTFVFGFLVLDDIPADKYLKIVYQYYTSPKQTRYENDYSWDEGYNIRKENCIHEKKKRIKTRKKIKENEY